MPHTYIENIIKSVSATLLFYKTLACKTNVRFAVFSLCCFYCSNLMADKDKFEISLGGYFIDKYDSNVSLTDESSGVGVLVDPEKTLDMESESSVFRLESDYRFTDEHMINFSWYQIKSDGLVSMSEEVDWVDKNGEAITIPFGAEVRTKQEYNIYKLSYMWSFYQNNKVEIKAGAGLHVTQLKMDLTADVTSSGVSAENVSTTLPLPVFSAGIIYHITPRLHWYLDTEAFALSFDEWDGNYTDTEVGIEYALFDHFGVGMGVTTNSIEIDETTDDYKLHYENRITGVMIYISAGF